MSSELSPVEAIPELPLAQAGGQRPPEHCGHRDVLPMAGVAGFSADSWCGDCAYYKAKRTRKREDEPAPRRLSLVREERLRLPVRRELPREFNPLPPGARL